MRTLGVYRPLCDRHASTRPHGRLSDDHGPASLLVEMNVEMLIGRIGSVASCSMLCLLSLPAALVAQLPSENAEADRDFQLKFFTGLALNDRGAERAIAAIRDFASEQSGGVEATLTQASRMQRDRYQQRGPGPRCAPRGAANQLGQGRARAGVESREPAPGVLEGVYPAAHDFVEGTGRRDRSERLEIPVGCTGRACRARLRGPRLLTQSAASWARSGQPRQTGVAASAQARAAAGGARRFPALATAQVAEDLAEAQRGQRLVATRTSIKSTDRSEESPGSHHGPIAAALFAGAGALRFPDKQQRRNHIPPLTTSDGEARVGVASYLSNSVL